MHRWSLILLSALEATSVAAQSQNPIVIIETNHGSIKLELLAEKAPRTVNNFLQYVDDRFYDGTIFHRVINNFMIQGGGFVPGFKEKATRPPIKYESTGDLRNVRGSVAMARTANPDSGTVQFFINVKDNDFLDKIKPSYTVFGKVIAGMDVVDKIKAVPTGTRQQFSDVPVEDVMIRTIRRAAHLHLVVGNGASYAAGKVFTVTAYVEHPVRGQALTLELPVGLQRVEGREIQPVAVIADIAISLVVWRVRGLRAGEYDCVVRSNSGVVQSKKIKVTATAN